MSWSDIPAGLIGFAVGILLTVFAFSAISSAAKLGCESGLGKPCIEAWIAKTE